MAVGELFSSGDEDVAESSAPVFVDPGMAEAEVTALRGAGGGE